MFEYIETSESGVIQNLQNSLRARGKVKIFYVPFHPFKKGFPSSRRTAPGPAGSAGSR